MKGTQREQLLRTGQLERADFSQNLTAEHLFKRWEEGQGVCSQSRSALKVGQKGGKKILMEFIVEVESM